MKKPLRRFRLVRTTTEVEKITVFVRDGVATAEHAIEVGKSCDEDPFDDDDYVQTTTVTLDPDYPEQPLDVDD